LGHSKEKKHQLNQQQEQVASIAKTAETSIIRKKIPQNNLEKYRKKQHSNNKDTWEQRNMTEYSTKF